MGLLLLVRLPEQKAMDVKSEFVFTSTGRVPFSGFSKSKARLDARADLAEPWRLHDLRRSVATHMAEELKIAPHIIEACLNHISGSKAGVAGVYNRALHLPERREALTAWANYLMTLVGGEQGDCNVIDLRKAAG